MYYLKSADIGKILFITRVGSEFFPQDVQNGEENETATQNTEAVTFEQLIAPLQEMARKLQLLADHKEYISSNIEGASVYNMVGGDSEGGIL